MRLISLPRIQTMVFLLLPLLLFVFLSSQLVLKDPAIWPDEVYFENMAQNLNNTGHLSVSLFGDTLPDKLHIRSYNYPPVYIYILAIWIKLFGSSVLTIRLLSVTVGFVTLCLFFFLCQIVTRSSRTAMIGTFMLLLSPSFGMAAHIARMEILVLLFFLLSLTTAMKQKLALASCFAVLACLTHPIGIFSILVVLLHVRKPAHVFILLSAIACGALWWLTLVYDRFDLFIAQMQTLIVYKTQRESLLNLLFQNDLSWRIVILSYLILGSSGCIIGYLQKKMFLLLSGIATFIVCMFVLYGIDQWYFVFLPVFPILLSLTSKNLYYLPAILLLLFHGYITIPAGITAIQRNDNYYTFSEGVLEQIPEQKKVVISAIPDPYFILRNRPDLTLYHMPTFVNGAQIASYLNDKDIIVYNYALNSVIPEYISQHTVKKITVLQENGYQADVIFLKKY